MMQIHQIDGVSHEPCGKQRRSWRGQSESAALIIDIVPKSRLEIILMDCKDDLLTFVSCLSFHTRSHVNKR
jgi:hypothetical protein